MELISTNKKALQYIAKLAAQNGLKLIEFYY